MAKKADAKAIGYMTPIIGNPQQWQIHCAEHQAVVDAGGRGDGK